MITKQDLQILYQWAKDSQVYYRTAPTAEGYSNKPISYCWVKGESVSKCGNSVVKYIRKKIIKNIEVENIYNNSEIIFSMFAAFDTGTELGPHRDPNIYREPYKRIQIPISIPDREKCYMIWKGEKVHWNEGEPRVFEVMDYIHEGYNYSHSAMKFLMVDVKKSTEVELINN
jgi:hypothetical protein